MLRAVCCCRHPVPVLPAALAVAADQRVRRHLPAARPRPLHHRRGDSLRPHLLAVDHLPHNSQRALPQVQAQGQPAQGAAVVARPQVAAAKTICTLD